MSLSVYKANSLAYPGYRLSGFDPTHVAMSRGGQCFASCVPSGANFYSLLNGAVGTFTGPGTFTPQINSLMGPTVLTGPTTSGNKYSLFSCPSTWSNITLGVFFSLVTSINFQEICSIGGASQTVQLAMSGSNLQIFDGTGVAVFAPTAGIFYFLCFSYKQGGVSANVAYTNLATGQIITRTTTNSGSPGSAANFAVGAVGNPGNVVIGPIAFITNNFLSLPELTQWAADPWAFWYPRTLTDTMFNDLRSSTLAAIVPFQVETGQTYRKIATAAY